MKAIELAEQIMRANGHKLEAKVVISTYSPGSVGGSPCVDAERANFGFDWDNGKFIIQPKTQLTELESNEVLAIVKSVREGSSWHAYERDKKNYEKIKMLESEIEYLKSQLSTKGE